MRVVLRQEAEDDLNRIYDYLREISGDAELAFEVIWNLREACLSLSDLPQRGTPRNDVRKNLRILIARKVYVIAYEVTDVVTIIDIFHGSQDWTKTLLQ